MSNKGKMILTIFFFTFLLSFPFSVLAQEIAVKKGSMKPTGLLQATFSHFFEEKKSDTFSLRRAEVGFPGKLSKHVSYNIRLGVDGGHTWPLREASFKATYIPKIELTLGQFKPPFGLEVLTSSSKLDFVEKSYSTRQCKCKPVERDIGVQARLNTKYVDCRAALVNGTGGNVFADDNDWKDFVGRVQIKPPVEGLSVGIDGYLGKKGEKELDRNRYGFDLSFTKEPYMAKAELLGAKNDKVDSLGFYVQAGYTVKLGKEMLLKKIQPVARFERWDGNIDKEKDASNIITIGINLFFDDTKLQVNYLLVREEDTQVDNDKLLTLFQVSF